jgi:hypothetical protein
MVGLLFPMPHAYLYEGKLFVCFACHIEIFKTMALLALVGVHEVSFILFLIMVEKLLNIEQFFIEKSFKSKLKFLAEFGHFLGIVGKPLMNRI